MKILVGMSGGLDSAYAARRLMDEGHEVEGAVLVMHSYTDVEAARLAAYELGIKLHVVDCTERFNVVVDNFVNEYCNARTPNPCIICNPFVKFRCLFDYAMEHKFDMIATGHYARAMKISDYGEQRFALVRAKDRRKDQTYMLYRLPQEILAKLVFPLSDSLKSEVRELAEVEGISAAGNRESQEICFIPDGDYASYIEQRVGKFREGDFVDTEGKRLGTHKGIIRYTLGQRKGLGVAAGDRIFVTDINPFNNVITLSKEASMTESLSLTDMVFCAMPSPPAGHSIDAEVKVRYLANPIAATVVFDGEGGARITLKQPERAVTPGQSAVIYDGDVLLCGGFISKI